MMLSVLVANTKGGCGKTTIATNLAAAFAGAGHRTLLADADRQHSALGWLKARPVHMPAIEGADWAKSIGKPGKKIDRVVIDAPAAMKKGMIEDLVKMADVIVLPVSPSAFDQGATESFLKKLDSLKPVRKSKKDVAIVGNRVRANTRAAARLDDFLGGLGHSVVTSLRDTQLYPEAANVGLGLYDFTDRRTALFREDWAPLVAFIEG